MFTCRRKASSIILRCYDDPDAKISRQHELAHSSVPPGRAFHGVGLLRHPQVPTEEWDKWRAEWMSQSLRALFCSSVSQRGSWSFAKREGANLQPSERSLESLLP
jgi:hypothetical protein